MKKKLLKLALLTALACALLIVGASAASDKPEGSGTADDPYQIGTAAELCWFSDYVRTEKMSACAVLTSDIDLSGVKWTPIGEEYYTRYVGTFDGAGHSISGLNYDEKYSEYAGLFGYLGSGGTVKNLSVESGYVATGNVNSRAGGVCAMNYGGTVENCSFIGSVSAPGTGTRAGGVCGENYGGTVKNCYSSAAVTGADSGGVCGRNTGKVQNCYWLDTAYTGSGIGRDEGSSESVEAKTADEFASGEVTWLLNGMQKDGPWYQTLGSDAYPTLDSTHGKVVQNFGGVGGGFDCEIGDTIYDKNGFGYDGGYQPAALVDGVYQIGNAGQLYWFAEQVNDRNRDINAVLTKDITIQTGVPDAVADNSTDDLTAWTPIGSYTGTFDGQGCTISGLYVKISRSSENVYAGLFGNVGSGGKVQNLSIADSYISGSASGDYNVYAYVGGVCGYNDGGRIENCSNSATVTGSTTVGSTFAAYVGGVCGVNYAENSSATITNCCNTGSVSSNSEDVYVGGVCGYSYAFSNTATITNCCNAGKVTGTGTYVGGVCGINNGYEGTATITNCYWLTGTASTGIGRNIGYATVRDVASKTSTEFASGEVAWLLNKYETGSAWAVGDNGYPVLRPEQENKVVKLTIDGEVSCFNSGYKFEGVEGTGYYLDGEMVELPYTVDEDTVLSTKALYVVTVDGTAYYVDPNVGSFTLPAAPSKPGYIFMGWSNGYNTFQPGDEVGLFGDTDFKSVWANMPDITSPEPDKPDELPFTDVPKTAWYYDAVKTAYEAGIMKGVTDTEFEPDGTLTRAMFWTILARVDGVDTDGGATWYDKAQAWAIENGVSDGLDAAGSLTREQLVTMLWRLNGEPVVDYLITSPDASQISSWALEAMRWAASIGLIEGDETGALAPTATTTRAQAATFMVRYLAVE